MGLRKYMAAGMLLMVGATAVVKADSLSTGLHGAPGVADWKFVGVDNSSGAFTGSASPGAVDNTATGGFAQLIVPPNSGWVPAPIVATDALSNFAAPSDVLNAAW